MRRVPALRQLDQRGTGNAGGKFVREGRWRRRVAQADHDQRGIADRAELGASIELGERAASRGEIFRLGSMQARLTLLGDRRMCAKEIVGETFLAAPSPEPQAELRQLLGDAVAICSSPGPAGAEAPNPGRLTSQTRRSAARRGAMRSKGGAVGKQPVQQHQVAPLAQLHDIERGIVGGHSRGLLANRGRPGPAARDIITVRAMTCTTVRRGPPRRTFRGDIQWRQR